MAPLDAKHKKRLLVRPGLGEGESVRTIPYIGVVLSAPGYARDLTGCNGAGRLQIWIPDSSDKRCVRNRLPLSDIIPRCHKYGG